jgi:Acetyltransferase (GNAT) domain
MSPVQFQPGEVSQQQWTDLSARSHALSLLQTWEYGEARKGGSVRVERGTFVRGGELVGCCQALVRLVPFVRGGAVWINRGPLPIADDPDGWLMSEMLATLKKYWVDQRGCYLRIAPRMLAGVDGAAVPAGYALTTSRGWSSSRVDLRMPVEELRHGLNQRWRRCLKKAEQLSLRVTASTESRDFADFVIDHERFIQEKDFKTSVTPLLLRRLQALLPLQRRMVVIRAAAAENGPMGAILIARYGRTGEYLAGIVRDEGRSMYAGHLLMWNAMLYLKNLGFDAFDLGGLDPDLTPTGIFDFKEGVGGTPYRLIGEWESHDGRLISRVVAARVHRQRAAAEIGQ